MKLELDSIRQPASCTAARPFKPVPPAARESCPTLRPVAPCRPAASEAKAGLPSTKRAGAPISGLLAVTEPRKNHVFLAVGPGIVPLRAILLDLHQRKQPVNILLLYMDSSGRFACKGSLEWLRKTYPYLRIQYSTSLQRFTPRCLEQLQRTFRHPVFFIAGPERAVQTFESTLQALQVSSARIKIQILPDAPEQGRGERTPALNQRSATPVLPRVPDAMNSQSSTA